MTAPPNTPRLSVRQLSTAFPTEAGLVRSVTDVSFDIQPGRKQATRIHWKERGVEGGVDLGPDDLVFITIGSLTSEPLGLR